MNCKVCGRPIVSEHSNFCDYCGAPVRRLEAEQNMQPAGNVNQNMYQANEPQWTGSSEGQWNNSQPNMGPKSMVQGSGYPQQREGQDSKEKPVSFRQWVGIMLLPYIPFVGAISYVVMLFVWAFGRDTEETKKNWARARLVTGIVILFLSGLFLASILKGLDASGMNLQDYIQKTYY